ncbi:MAG TPA: LysE family transporter [Bryobacteraceae bacterium]|jgi:threonine/homoserine/homoserine lactone efflux protein|nr:LysE family transporter [Bryobacteraceae bacterium]
MNVIELLLRGAAAGLAISAPVGPVNVLCVSRTITNGRASGIVSGLGAAAADTIYGSVAGFSISFIISWLMREIFWIRLVGGLLLIAIGVVYYFKHPKTLEDAQKNNSSGSAIASSFLLTLTNPTTILSFLAVLAILGLGEHRPPLLTMFLVAGIFAGAMIWWTLLAFLAGHFRDRFNDHAMVWMNRIAAGAIGAFGLITIGMALAK